MAAFCEKCLFSPENDAKSQVYGAVKTVKLGQVLGGDSFKDKIEAISKQRIRPLKRGRPKLVDEASGEADKATAGELNNSSGESKNSPGESKNSADSVKKESHKNKELSADGLAASLAAVKDVVI